MSEKVKILPLVVSLLVWQSLKEAERIENKEKKRGQRKLNWGQEWSQGRKSDKSRDIYHISALPVSTDSPISSRSKQPHVPRRRPASFHTTNTRLRLLTTDITAASAQEPAQCSAAAAPPQADWACVLWIDVWLTLLTRQKLHKTNNYTLTSRILEELITQSTEDNFCWWVHYVFKGFLTSWNLPTNLERWGGPVAYQHMV